MTADALLQAVGCQDSPQVTQDSPQVTQDSPQVTQDSPQVTQDNPQVTQDSPQVAQAAKHALRGRLRRCEERAEEAGDKLSRVEDSREDLRRSEKT